MDNLLKPINQFLGCTTPDEWVMAASQQAHLSVLLIDHANCELKAAQTAMLLLRRYAVNQSSGEALLAWLKPFEDFVYRKIGDGDFSAHISLSKKLIHRSDFIHGDEMINKMVLLIKEELHHFQQVLEIMTSRGIAYDNLSASRYAKGLMRHVRTHEPAKLIDTLICGAIIEARSCERFAKLAPVMDTELHKFYLSLLRSEARHFEDYLSLARTIATQQIDERVAFFIGKEVELINRDDEQIRFHSGIPLHTNTTALSA